MAPFQMCTECQAEYDDPSDRRFHAQPNACPECGPSVALVDASWAPSTGIRERDPIAAAAAVLARGAIVAIKGIGGYHLACRADLEQTVASLRARKHREDKPFALMAPNLKGAEQLIELDRVTRELLCSAERPIVLAPRVPDGPVAVSVAPGAPELGVMLPYSPLHHLLLADVGAALVMTSGNRSDEPIAYRDEDALERLAGIADLFLIHDRTIETRTDDSVTRVVSVGDARRPGFLRRSRGYVPASLTLPGEGATRPMLACGAELKSTFCVAKGARAWVSHHIGDLENYATLRSFRDGIDHFERLFAVTPEVVAHDLHPEYLSTKYALERAGVQLVGVQHHHAHLAACLAEHGELGQVVAAIFDGTGYGLDGTVWGGELLCGGLADVRRVGSLRAVVLPGGAQAIKQPWRMACAWLREAAPELTGLPASLEGQIEPARWDQVSRLVQSGFSSPATTSMGRLFDAIAALCAIRTETNYEGQAAIELEAACEPGDTGHYPIELVATDGWLEIDPRQMIAAVLADLDAGVSAGRVATRFHASIADIIVRACERLASEHATGTVVLSGGVFANRRLLESASGSLKRVGLRVLTPERLPANDGGISYGQVAVAAAQGL
jgi:hydrogenase maturation protein HypF